MSPRLVLTHLHRAAIWRNVRSHMATATISRRRPTNGPDAGRQHGQGAERFGRLITNGDVGSHGHLLLLGLDVIDTVALVELLEQGLAYAAFEQLAMNSGLSSDTLQGLIDIPSRTMARRRQDGRFHSDESDRLVRAARIVGGALALFEGDREAAARWLTSPQRGLGGAMPVQFARMEVGALEVERLMERLNHGVVA